MSDSRKPYTMTPAALAARRANIEKAHAAPKEKIYRPTPERQAASRTNMQRAIAARKSPAGIAAARLNAEKHGTFVKTDFAGSFSRVGENPEEFKKLFGLPQSVFLPADEEELACVLRIAEVCWKRMRMFRVQAFWEHKRLKKLLTFLRDRDKVATLPELYRRAAIIYDQLDYYPAYVDEIFKYRGKFEALMNKLLLKKSYGSLPFKTGVRREHLRTTIKKVDRMFADPFSDEALREIEQEQKRIEWRAQKLERKIKAAGCWLLGVGRQC